MCGLMDSPINVWSFTFFNELFITYSNILCSNFLRNVIKFGFENYSGLSFTHMCKFPYS